MSHDEHKAMNTAEKLVYMANQIAAFFETMPHDEAAAGVAKHINDFWDPRMRRQFFAIVEAGDAGLRPLVIDAVPMIKRPAPAEKPAGVAS
ncbi:MAG TPA: formate dehydrogenase subunit delta [Rhizobiaceae bacterium]|nr:formate dehydrogenase subunit delta [Rhizobiaceae bacterium]